MSKIIIHNNSKLTDETAVDLVRDVISNGFVSGANQYRWMTNYPYIDTNVHAKPTRGTTHTFEVRDIE